MGERIILIGKSSKSDYQIRDDNTVSRRHAKIFIDSKKGIFITDLESKNGTFVSGKKLPKGGSKKLIGHELVKVGKTVVELKEF